ncbi:fat storage-inducing transmembrane protein-like [Pollicipes pollicipes]|uniref:fat storage-inducing transmembrane protein-like n=1 Tax=Pollicipes pollicipes TaxID=41117 RepID=UPI0018854E5E|nr:fat storage-inducing transmembrane protein-like [Pollicipes pollicipes]
MAHKGNRSGSKSAVGLKFRPSSAAHSQTGTKPVPDQASPQQIFILVIIHLCRKVLFVDTEMKIGLYLFLLFVGSTVGDLLVLPKSYFSNKHNMLNQYFVKLGWGWTFVVVGSFMMLTANVYCCRQRPRMQKHITRLVCATIAWYMFTSMFVYIEGVTGICRTKAGKYTSKEACLDAGFKWSGLEISGHAFILIFNSLFIMEEAKAICGWEGIKDMIRNEDFARKAPNKDEVDDTPLQHVMDSDYEQMKVDYVKFTPHVKVLFVLLTMLSILWDVMLVGTILYFHTMVQKMCGGIIAIMAWFFLYRYLYPQGFACLPGQGAFKYQKDKPKVYRPFRAPSFVFKRRNSASKQPSTTKDELPKFMGMPLYALKNNTGESTMQDSAGSK